MADVNEFFTSLVQTMQSDEKAGCKRSSDRGADDVCACECHRSGGNIFAHVRPCCEQCPYCGRNIKIHAFEGHQRQCMIDHPESLRAIEARRMVG